MDATRQLSRALAGLALAAAAAAGGAVASGATATEPELTATRGADPRLSQLTVRVDGNLARVSFRLDGAIDEAFTERLASGLPTGFVYQLELLKDRKRWFDRPLETNTLQVVAMYDAATRGYLINYKLDGKLVESRMVRELADLERAMTRVEDLPAFELDSVPRAWRLLVRARAQVGSRTLFAFVPSRVTTDWRESRKFRSLNDLPAEG